MPTPRSPVPASTAARAAIIRNHAAPSPSAAPEALRYCVVPRWSEDLPDGRRINVRFAVSCYENKIRTFATTCGMNGFGR